MALKAEKINISKGYWPAQANTFVPDGYTAACQNLVKTPKGNWALRGSFQGQLCNWTNANFTDYTVTILSSSPAYDKCHVSRAFEFSVGTDSPAIIISWTDGTDKYFKMVNAWNTGGNNRWGEGKLVNHKEWSAMCQYKDRIYGCDNVHPVAKLTGFGNFNGTVGTVTSTDMGLPIANNSDKIGCLVTVNDRIFASAGNRIWFTEVAAAGGYPENWNSGNNFIDIIVERGVSLIAKMIPLNDRLYIFTDKGIYALNCKGSASSWVLQLIVPDASIFTYNSVARIGKVFIYNDRNRMYTFNGSVVQPILPQLEESFATRSTCEIFPFEEGVLLQFQSATAGAAGGSYTFSASDFYYFDGVALSTFTLPGNFSSTGICGGFINKYTSVDLNQPRSYIIGRDSAYCYKANNFAQDSNFSANYPYDHVLSIPERSEIPYRLKKMHEVFIEAFVGFNFNNALATPYIDGGYGTAINFSGSGSTDFVREFKFGVAKPTRKFGFTIQGTWTGQGYLKPGGLGIPRTMPPLEYRDVYVIYEEMDNFPTDAGYVLK